jgi:uncharacterized BrkB/YihY/UPF0761 family membrane protein
MARTFRCASLVTLVILPFVLFVLLCAVWNGVTIGETGLAGALPLIAVAALALPPLVLCLLALFYSGPKVRAEAKGKSVPGALAAE